LALVGSNDKFDDPDEFDDDNAEDDESEDDDEDDLAARWGVASALTVLRGARGAPPRARRVGPPCSLCV